MKLILVFLFVSFAAALLLPKLTQGQDRKGMLLLVLFVTLLYFGLDRLV